MKKPRSLTLKLLFDVVLLLLLALMYRKMAISMQFHEWGGIALCLLFVVHKLVNRKWIGGITSGIFRGKIKLNALWIVDVLLFIAMAAVLITGLCISKTLPTAIKAGFSLKTWHYFAAAMSLLLAGIHLGLHWPIIRAAVLGKCPVKGKAATVLGVLVLCAVLGFGGYSLATTSTLSWFTRPFTSISSSGGQMPRFEGNADGEKGRGEQDHGFSMPGEGKVTEETAETDTAAVEEATQGEAPSEVKPSQTETESSQAEAHSAPTDTESSQNETSSAIPLHGGRPEKGGNGSHPMGGQAAGGTSVWQTISSFASILLFFAILTGAVCELKRRRLLKKAAGKESEVR